MRKKLIEVALPLEAINEASARQKVPRPGHPSTLHLWWARRPLAACRAVLFGQLVDDPSSVPEEFPDVSAQERERQRLFRVIEELVQWENSNSERVIYAARREIARSVARARGETPPRTNAEIDAYLADNAPPVFDPFCGGGSIPLEAQRLGLQVYASDLNPVAVLITKALVEIPPKFAGLSPVNPEAQAKLAQGGAWNSKGAQGLAGDVRYYGQRVRDEAEKRIGQIYPKALVTSEMAEDHADLEPYVGQEFTIIAWLWARTVPCKSPACGANVPMIGQYWLSKKPHKRAWLDPVVDNQLGHVRFRPKVGTGGPAVTNKVGGRRVGFRCLVCDEIVDSQYLSEQGQAGRIGSQLVAVIADGPRGRLYLPPSDEQERAARSAEPEWKPESKLPDYSQALPTATYGSVTWADLFSQRQLVALNAFANIIAEIRQEIANDSLKAGLIDDNKRLADGGVGADGYADAISVYLGLAVGKLANRGCAFCFWDSGAEKVQQPFAQQGINKTWDYCEANPFSEKTGGWFSQIKYTANVVENSPIACRPAIVTQTDVINNGFAIESALISCDPPYYTNIGYADLSDFFYLWHRRALRTLFPNWYATLLTPKDPELVAVAYRHGGKKRATKFFQDGLAQAFARLRNVQANGYPMAIYYSKKQEEFGKEGETSSTGWEVMLDGLLKATLIVERTWPVKAEHTAALKKNKGALERATVLACGSRPSDAETVTRRDVVAMLKRELPGEVRQLQSENIAPVDLAQAAIGPGMAVFSRYAQVLEADGSPMSCARR